MRKGRARQWLVVALCACVAGTAWGAERVIYVDAAATGANNGASWSDAHLVLQDALAAAAGLDTPVEIRIAQGTYTPDKGVGVALGDTRAAFQLLYNVALKGGYAGGLAANPNTRDTQRYATILSGDLGGDGWEEAPEQGNSRYVLTGDETDETTVLDGLTITGGFEYGLHAMQGSPRLNDCRFVENNFAGIYAWDSNSVLTHCTFVRNGLGVISRGGLHSVRGNHKLIDCEFIENAGGGIDWAGSLELLRCSFVGNTAFGGAAVHCFDSLTARKCTFTGNRGTAAVQCFGTASLVDCVFTRNSSRSVGALDAWGTLNLYNCEFVGNTGGFRSGAVSVVGDMLTARGCLFAGNSCAIPGVGALSSPGVIMRLSNCTFAGNRGWPNALEHSPIPGAIAEMTQCIVRDGPEPFTRFATFPPEIKVTYSNVEGGYAGLGNIDVDPAFVAPGYWDPNGTPDDPNDDVWVLGDYHLKSQAGHWDRQSGRWVLDDVTSPCIDLGDPNGPLGSEPFPNGGYVNLGAYGGASEASRSYFGGPICETQIAGDINGDCKVDDLDMDILMSHWLTDAYKPANVPPSITLISPAEGDEIASGTPMVLRAEASDLDGRVIQVRYHLTWRREQGRGGTGARATDPTDDWKVEWEWWSIIPVYPDGVYTIRAEALDDQGAKTMTPEIEIKLVP